MYQVTAKCIGNGCPKRMQCARYHAHLESLNEDTITYYDCEMYEHGHCPNIIIYNITLFNETD